MADVQPEHGYTKIADAILEQMARIKLSPTQYRILFVVWRFTYGFNRKEHELTLGFISNATGCEKRQLQRELKGLEDRKIIFQKVTNGVGRKIGFNKNHDEWIGRTTIGEMTIGETAIGEIVKGTLGETDNGTIGETTNQEIHSFKDNIKDNISSASMDEILEGAFEIESYFCQKRGKGLKVNTDDFGIIQEVVSYPIPIEFIKSVIDSAFAEYKPRYPKDCIGTFSYIAPKCYEQWIRKSKPFQAGGQSNETYRRGVQPGRTQTAGFKPSISDDELDEYQLTPDKVQLRDMPGYGNH